MSEGQAKTEALLVLVKTGAAAGANGVSFGLETPKLKEDMPAALSCIDSNSFCSNSWSCWCTAAFNQNALDETRLRGSTSYIYM